MLHLSKISNYLNYIIYITDKDPSNQWSALFTEKVYFKRIL